ncbi:MAG: hypothetical protein A3F84_07575 [Candidatus Handelsmanbacteria bacterium RIFCSPLOWO2_12_FULL_64_10]|uniref:ATP-grasp domain-containing protein n=1 Tax=Handelsmanbacteria sp. (strain RIFCSPLOWO2_12_FULL_64_10) TaxID=1817868 RepID=A0A1F6CRH5_HANXR|nr:MAG: hypothetical protein A3F84_07575 [Candidatus Handelsmanbacteria bacterium RIFCSPLOWO2_12_FULL_64_10]
MRLSGTPVAVAFDAARDARYNPREIIQPADDIAPAAAAVAGALRRAGAETALVPVFAEIERTIGLLRALEPAVVFNLCESFRGLTRLEPNVAALLEMLGLAFTGSGPDALRLCLHKQRTKDVLSAHGVRVPRGGVVGSLPKMEFPMIVKPEQEDASTGLTFDSIVRDDAALVDRVAALHCEVGSPVLVEEYVEGREFNVAFVGDEILPVSEIDFAGLPAGAPAIVTHAGKWMEPSADYIGTVPVCPANVPARLHERLRALGRQCFDLTGVRGYGRVDVRLDARDRLYVLEVNPNPDLSAAAGLARAAAAAGWSHDELIVRIAETAMHRVGV